LSKKLICFKTTKSELADGGFILGSPLGWKQIRAGTKCFKTSIFIFESEADLP